MWESESGLGLGRFRPKLHETDHIGTTRDLPIDESIVAADLKYSASVAGKNIAVRQFVNAAGRVAEPCGMSAIADPNSGPRKALLNTRIVKNEFGATAKRNASNFCAGEPIPFSRVKSISIATLPLSTIIF